MMGDVNKTIEISYKGNVKNLVDGLSKVGRVSERESRKTMNNWERTYKRNSRNSRRSTNQINRHLQSIAATSKMAGGAMSTAFAGATVAIAAATVAIVAFTKHIADMSNQLVDTSEKTGVAVDTLNGLRLAANGSGLSFQELEMGLIKLPQQMQAAADGSKKAQKAFANLGVQTSETVDGFTKLRSADAVLKDVFESLKKVTSAEEKAARASEVFGRMAGPKFVQSGAIDNLDAFVSLANEFGVASGPEMQKQMALFQRNFSTAGMVAQGEFLRLLDVLMGGEGGSGTGINKAITGITEGIIIFGSVASNVIGGLNLHIQSLMFRLLPVIETFSSMATIARGASVRDPAALIKMIRSFRETTSNFGEQQVINEINTQLAGEIGERFRNPFAAAQKRLDEFRKQRDPTLQNIDPRRRGNQQQQQQNKELEKQKKTESQISKIKEYIAELDNTSYDLAVKIADLNNQMLPIEQQKAIKQDEKLSLIDREIAAVRLLVEDQVSYLSTLQQTAEIVELITELEISGAKKIAVLREQQGAIRLKSMHDLGAAVGANIGQMLQQIDLGIKHGNLLQNNAKTALLIADNLPTMINLSADLLETFGQESKKQQEIAFGIRKAAALAEVTIETAKNVVAVAPLGPVAMGAMGAIGMAQFAIIAAQKPKFHMGGLIDSTPLQPDEQMIRAQKGEAVLNTAAVSNIGSAGVNALNSGANLSPTIIVTNPFKHYDRFITARKLSGIDVIGTGMNGY